jgi:hypothetical protein
MVDARNAKIEVTCIEKADNGGGQGQDGVRIEKAVSIQKKLKKEKVIEEVSR